MSDAVFDYDRVAAAVYSQSDFLEGLMKGSSHLEAAAIRKLSKNAGIIVAAGALGASSVAAGVVTSVGAIAAGTTGAGAALIGSGGAVLVPLAAYGVWKYFRPKDWTKSLVDIFKSDPPKAGAFSPESIAEITEKLIRSMPKDTNSLSVKIAEQKDVKEFGLNLGAAFETYEIDAKIGFNLRRDRSVRTMDIEIQFK